jgi:hypothetical protein
MLEAALTIGGILALFLVLRVLILWIENRGDWVGGATKQAHGAVSLLIGLAILGWVVFKLVAPTEAFQRSYHGIPQIGVPLAMVWFGWRWLRSTPGGIESLPPDFTCRELDASVQKARQTLPWFIEQVQHNVDNARIKFPLTTPSGSIEHIWGYVHSYHDGRFNVSLANTPFDPSLDATGRRDVAEEEVEDWSIEQEDGRIRGAYSVIALFEHLEANGKKLNRTMRQQKVQFIDA